MEALHLKLQRSFNKRVISGGRVFVGHNRHLIQQGYYYYAFAHHPMHVITLPADTFTITCLRDPVQRVLSHYRMLVGLQREGSNVPAARLHGHKAAGSLGHYLDVTPRHELLQQIYHFSRSLDPAEAARAIAGCTAVLRTETLAQGFERLSETLGVTLRARHDRRSPTDIPIEQGDLDRLREAMEPEYDMLRRLRELRPDVAATE